MSIKIGHASIDERGKATGGAAGDQTGKEVCVREWYNKSWHSVARPKKDSVAKASVTACKAGCANDNIGYDQSQRTTLYTQAVVVSYDLSKIKTKCECDCSSFMAVCAIAAGVKVSKDIYTGNMVAALKATGEYDILTDSKYLTSDKYLKAGDILVCNGHTVMALENGSAVTTSSSASSTSKKSVSEIADEVIAGKWGSGDDRKKRLESAGYSYSEVQAKVNEKLSGKTTTTTKSVETIAKEVIAGKWGNGDDRKKKIEAAGYNYSEVQKKVNALLK